MGHFGTTVRFPHRDVTEIPHPTVTETLSRLGKKSDRDPEIHFTHLNHTNPLLDNGSLQSEELVSMGWEICKEGSVFYL